jgi:hypothetical protein
VNPRLLFFFILFSQTKKIAVVVPSQVLVFSQGKKSKIPGGVNFWRKFKYNLGFPANKS